MFLKVQMPVINFTWAMSNVQTFHEYCKMKKNAAVWQHIQLHGIHQMKEDGPGVNKVR